VAGNARGSRGRPFRTDTSWDHVAAWYDGWVGQRGSRYHRSLAIPLALELLDLRSGEHVLDVGCGQGVLASRVASLGGRYTGVDLSEQLIARARSRRDLPARFLVGDARRLDLVREIRRGSFDAAVFLFSIQDMDGLDSIMASVAWALRERSRVVLVMTHPAFRIPRHSGWGFDGDRRLAYRRVDSYLTPMAVPMNAVPGAAPTRAHHRPISTYVNELARAGFTIDVMAEVPDLPDEIRPARRGVQRSTNADIPLLLGLRARRG